MAKNTNQIKSAFLINGVLSVPFYLAIGAIGICAYILFPQLDQNLAIPAIIDHFIPFGFKGLVIAGMLAIFMSTADSILNIGAIAITHDLIGSITKTHLPKQTQLFLVRLSSIFIALGAITIALQFSNVLDVIFLIMVLGNSVFFPGYFLGILGLHGSKLAFWIGVVAGIITVIVGVGILKVFMLHVMLIAIAINCSVHIVENIVTKQRTPFALRMVALSTYPKKASYFARYFLFNNWIKNQDYCSIFAVCNIALSIFPFFYAETVISPKTNILLTLNGIVASISFLVLFREIWWASFVRNFPIFWAVLLVISLPLQTFIALLWSGLSAFWLIDTVVILPLLFMLTSRKGVIFTVVSGIIVALIIFTATKDQGTINLSNFAQLSVFLHSTVLVICVVLFRKRDVEICKSTSSILLHEANRSLSTFETAITYIDIFLPELVMAYNTHVPEGIRAISKNDLEELKKLPKSLTETSRTTSVALTNLLNRVKFYSSGQLSSIDFLISECVVDALKTLSLSEFKERFSFCLENDISLSGEKSLLTQAFINIIENATTAMKSTQSPRLEITVKNKTIIFKDNGCGITPSNLPNIFDELFTTKPSSNSGLGLAFCKQVVAEHAGLISCRSKPDIGTIFEIFFPNSKVSKEA